MEDTGQAAEPVTLERGRYRLSQAPDGALVIARAGGLCESCASCSCGTPAPQITVPAAMIRMAGSPVMAKFRAMLGGAVSTDGQ